MGYTHYWTQRRNFTAEEWGTVSGDLRALLNFAENERGIVLADGCGDGGTRPDFTKAWIIFNGLGDDSHESFVVDRIRPPKEPWEKTRGGGFCKTERKPYDVVTTACLCYLATIAETHDASSDGRGRDWVAGLELAQEALPRYANRIDIPMGILRADRWCQPWQNTRSERYSFNFCVDGRAYIYETRNESKCYRFDNWMEAAQFVVEHPEVFDQWGYFDQARHRRLDRLGTALCKKMVETGSMFEPERATPPPAYVRPFDRPEYDDDMPGHDALMTWLDENRRRVAA